MYQYRYIIGDSTMITQAIRNLRPTASFAIEGETYEDLKWHEVNVEPAPSKEEVDAEVSRLQAEWNKSQYQRQRAPEYPPIGDQLDALFHAGVFPSEMAAKIQAVKDKYPKG